MTLAALLAADRRIDQLLDEKRELRERITNLESRIRIGEQMSNVLYSLCQLGKLESADIARMNSLRRSWDAARIAPPNS